MPHTKKNKQDGVRFLPEGYQPGCFDVLCGRGRKCFFHEGNRRFRDIVSAMVPEYTDATSKMEKGMILSSIVEGIRDKADIGGFLKKDLETGLWYEVGDLFAREKVSQAFRDLLCHKYKSSTAYKKMRREVEQTGELFDKKLPSRRGTIYDSTAVVPPNMELATDKMSPSMTCTIPSLMDMLDYDLKKTILAPPHDDVPTKIDDYSLEPVPLPGPNPYALSTSVSSSQQLLSFHKTQQLQTSSYQPALPCPKTQQLQMGQFSSSFHPNFGF